jgi:hypothetical protein
MIWHLIRILILLNLEIDKKKIELNFFISIIIIIHYL